MSYPIFREMPEKPHKVCRGCRFLKFSAPVAYNGKTMRLPYCNHIKHTGCGYELEYNRLNTYNFCYDKQFFAN